MEAVRSVHLTQVLQQQYRLFCQRRGEPPPFEKWRWRYTSAFEYCCHWRTEHGPSSIHRATRSKPSTAPSCRTIHLAS